MGEGRGERGERKEWEKEKEPFSRQYIDKYDQQKKAKLHRSKKYRYSVSACGDTIVCIERIKNFSAFT